MSAQSRRNFLKLSGGAVALGSFAGAPAFAQSPPVKIGVLAARSGVLASIGECALATVQWWADGVNKAGGILGRKVELVVEEEGNPKETAERFRKLALRDNVEMVTGLISTGSGLFSGGTQRTPLVMRASTSSRPSSGLALNVPRANP